MPFASSIVAVASTLAAMAPSSAAAPQATTAASSSPKVLASGLKAPWGLAVEPSGSILVTERDSAKIKRIPKGGGTARTVMTVPGVQPGGEGGLLGIALSPSYRSDKKVFVYFTSASDNRIVSFTLGAKKPTVVLKGLRKGQIHNGGRIAFGPDGKLYAGVGETGDTGLAQDRSSNNGKILRIDADGSIPSDNPFPGSPVWTLGHRNVQGLAWDSKGRMWASEFGQNTTDEVNRIVKGRNYGWPTVEGKGDTRGGQFTNPVVTWSPTSTSSPSGAAIIGNRLYVGALAGQRLWRIPLDGNSAGAPTSLYHERYGRIRAVLRDGSRILFTSSNSDGRGGASSDRLYSIRG